MPNRISARKRQRQRPYAIRKPKDYGISLVGDLVQLDTLDVRPLPGVLLKHFTAHDVISRWNTVSVYSRATANTATDFLDTLEKRMPFPVKAIQVDGVYVTHLSELAHSLSLLTIAEYLTVQTLVS